MQYVDALLVSTTVLVMVCVTVCVSVGGFATMNASEPANNTTKTSRAVVTKLMAFRRCAIG
ncbi:MAG: hypothetical protein JRN30_05405 [Nitrososphaerota archaeon]|nr:hypothetical protein [Nitrososphaerota archaeon]